MSSWVEEHIDVVTLMLVLLLSLVGIVSVYSATYDAGASAFFNRQILWAGLGLLLMLIIAFVPFRTLQLVAYPFYAFSLLILVVVLVVGKTVAGSTSWFGIVGLGLQPSELTKASTILALASYLSERHVNLHRLKDILKAVSFVFAPVVLIALQPDMGTALIYLGAALLILYWAGASNFFMIAIVAPLAAVIASLFGITALLVVLIITFMALLLVRVNRFHAAVVFSFTVLVGISIQFIFNRLAGHQQKRILTFINPDSDPLGAGYNVIQSKIAIGSGGLLGKGFLQGSQTQLNFLPAQWTDFIFCVPSEEFGFVGALIILVLLTALLVRGVRLASTVKSHFASLVAIGVVSIWTVHYVINVGMSMGMVPVIGVPLPFLSYGGSSMITNMVLAGLLMNMYINRKEY